MTQERCTIYKYTCRWYTFGLIVFEAIWGLIKAFVSNGTMEYMDFTQMLHHTNFGEISIMFQWSKLSLFANTTTRNYFTKKEEIKETGLSMCIIRINAAQYALRM